MSKLKIAILGMGASSLYCKSAIEHSGIDYSLDIYHLGEIKFSPGAFWLRFVPPTLNRDLFKEENIFVRSVGRWDHYTRKQWGKQYSSSFVSRPKIELGYNPLIVLPAMLNSGIGTYSMFLMKVPLTDEDISEQFSKYDIVFQTFPTDKSRVLMSEHKVMVPFTSRKTDYSANEVVYNGYLSHPVVRDSFLFGYQYKEYIPDYGGESYPDVKFTGKFPDIHPECPEWDPQDVPSKNVVLLGRYAEWSRKRLSHEAFQRTLDVLKTIA